MDMKRQDKDVWSILDPMKDVKTGFYREAPAIDIATIRRAIEKDVIPLGKSKILVMNDPHIPFHREDCLDIIMDHKHEIKAIVFGGDFLDCESISSFPAIERMRLEGEVVAGIDFLRDVRALVGPEVKIIIIRGNHENRMKMYLAKMHDKGMYKFLNPNILNMLRDGFTMYEGNEEKKFDGIKDVHIINSWYVNINDEVIVCHPNNYSRGDVKNVKTAIEYFVTEGAKFSTVIIGHNHHQGVVTNHLGKYGIESGCLCKRMEHTDCRTNVKPQDYGYVLVGFNDDGKVNKNLTKLYRLDAEEYIDDSCNVYIDL